MRKLDYLWGVLLVLFAGMGLAGCDEDDESVNAPQELYGSWDMYGETLTFNSDGTLIWTDAYGESESIAYSYDAGSGTIVLSAYGETETWRIISLDASTLVLQDSEGDQMTLTRAGSSAGEDDNAGEEPADQGGLSGGGEYDKVPSADLPAVDETYADVSGKYEILNAEECGYASIELMSWGQYIVTRYTGATYEANAHRPMTKKRGLSRSIYADDGIVVAGDFGMLAEDTYELSGWGTLHVGRNGQGEVVSFNLETYSGESYFVTVRRQPDREDTKRLCREWNCLEDRVQMYVNGTLAYDAAYTISENQVHVYVNKLGLDWREEEFFDTDGNAPVKALFSAAGTYTVSYVDGSVESSYWDWYDLDNNTIRAYDYWYGEIDESYHKVEYSREGNRIYLTATETEGDMSVVYTTVCGL